MTGKLKDSKVIIKDEKEGNRIYNKGYFGKPLSGGGLELSLLEAVYLSEADRLEIEDEDGNTLYLANMIQYNSEDRFLVKYPVYKDMRMRGYVVKKASDPVNFRVFPRGGAPGKTQTKYWIRANTETDTFSIKKILGTLNKVENLKKIFLQGLVDEEGDVTYYKITTIDLKGETSKTSINDLKGTLYNNKVIIEDKDSKRLHDDNFYGDYKNNRLNISILEALYLSEIDVLTVRDGFEKSNLSTDEIFDQGINTQDNFELRYDIYKDLRSRDLVPKTGFKYGAVFRAYEGDPDEHHAEYIGQPISSDYKCSWYEISRAVRVAHSVKKKFLFGIKQNDKIEYVKINRVTP